MPISQTPPRPIRLLYSIVSAILGLVLALCGLSFLQNPHSSFKEMWMGAIFFGILTLMPAIAGWIIALPLVLIFSNFYKWRFLLWWAIGTALGPLVILGYALYLYAKAPHLAGPIVPATFVWFAAIVACLTTLIYLLLVRFDQHLARRRTEKRNSK